METREFGARLRELRIQAGLNQRELADKIGVNFTYLSKIESGVMPPPSEKVILRLAEVLNADRDELMTLAGKIPSDIVQILKSQEALQLLRSRRTQQKSRVANKKEGINIMKNLVNYKRLSRVAIAAALVCAVAASLWFAAPLPVQALEISFVSLPTGTLGSTHSFAVKVDIANPDVVPIQSIDMEIYNVADDSKKITCTNLPLSAGGTATYSSSSGGTVSITDTTATNWQWFSGYGYALWEGTGYWFSPPDVYGYGYQVTGTASLEYTGTWISPRGWPSGGYKIKVTINTLAAKSPDTTQAFTEYSSEFTLSARRLGGGVPTPSAPPAVVEPGVTDVSDVITDEGVFTEEVAAESEDGNVELAIDEGTTGLTEEGEPLSEISITETEEPPAPGAWDGLEGCTVDIIANTVSAPLDSFSKYAVFAPANAVSLIYELGPSGATFDPPITVTFTYDSDAIPEGVSEEDLVISRWREGEVVAPPEEEEVAPPEEEEVVAPPEEEEVVAPPEEEEEVVVAPPEEEEEVVAEVAAPLAWWIWLIVGLAAIAVIGVVIWLVVRRRTA